jgi:hypothetical protein
LARKILEIWAFQRKIDEKRAEIRAENRKYLAKLGFKFEKNSIFGTENAGFSPKIDKNGSKMAKNGSKMAKNGSKMAENAQYGVLDVMKMVKRLKKRVKPGEFCDIGGGFYYDNGCFLL